MAELLEAPTAIVGNGVPINGSSIDLADKKPIAHNSSFDNDLDVAGKCSADAGRPEQQLCTAWVHFWGRQGGCLGCSRCRQSCGTILVPPNTYPAISRRQQPGSSKDVNDMRLLMHVPHVCEQVRCYIGDDEQRWYMWYDGYQAPASDSNGPQPSSIGTSHIKEAGKTFQG